MWILVAFLTSRGAIAQVRDLPRFQSRAECQTFAGHLHEGLTGKDRDGFAEVRWNCIEARPRWCRDPASPTDWQPCD